MRLLLAILVTLSMVPLTAIAEGQVFPSNYNCTLSWTSPATREDGSAMADSEIASYSVIVSGDASFSSPEYTTVYQTRVGCYDIKGIAIGQNYVTVTTVDNIGVESDVGAVVAFVISAARPSPIKVIRVE